VLGFAVSRLPRSPAWCHPQTTLRAAARRRGGGRRVVPSSSPRPLSRCCCCWALSSSFHPRSTPRAVAHGAGGGWCVVWVVLVSASALVSSLGPRGGVLGPFLVVMGPWCSFLVVVGARRHRQPHIPFEGEEGGCGRALRVFRRCTSLPVD
jgi:hypothetical protein